MSTFMMSALNRLTRRDMFRVTTGMGLSFLLPTLGARAAERRGVERAKSLITIWLGGGASQLETWDPHPNSPVGGAVKAIPTRIPECRISEFYPRVAEQLDAFSVVRSLVSKEGDHERATYYLKTGYRPDPSVTHPAVGAIAAHELADSSIEIPTHVSIGSGAWPARGGFLGNELDAFRVGSPGRPLRNITTRVNEKRQGRRLRTLDAISKTFREGRTFQTERTLHQETMRKALAMMSSEQLKAFELSEVAEAEKESYGDTDFGRGCLVARRLVETGVRAIEVSLPGFDTHAANFEGQRTQSQILDPALAALTKDLRERDLLDSTVVLVMTEFGRTPKINPLDGRDHWPTGFSCLIGGGGIASGRVIGETNPENTNPKKLPKDPVTVGDLYATVLASLGIDASHEYATPIGRPIAAADGTPIDRLWTPPKT